MIPIYAITPFTMLDYPGHLACIAWLAGCSMRCPYCYNPDIVNAKYGQHTEDELLRFLTNRKGRLDGVVFSGGECTACAELPRLCEKIKSIGFKIKIDTNGTYPQTITDLIANSLADYVALDYKAPPEKFEQITGSRHFDRFSQTLDLLLESEVNFEVRTTYHSALLNYADLQQIAADLHRRGYSKKLYIQNFVNGAKTLADLGPSTRLKPADLPELPLQAELRT
jgi:pyruvate formate lyase activating enzyme